MSINNEMLRIGNVKDKNGTVIHKGDRVTVPLESWTGSGGVCFVHSCSALGRGGGINIRVSDRETELHTGDFGWSAWVKPSECEKFKAPDPFATKEMPEVRA